jgi:hypothetical protein
MKLNIKYGMNEIRGGRNERNKPKEREKNLESKGATSAFTVSTYQ